MRALSTGSADADSGMLLHAYIFLSSSDDDIHNAKDEGGIFPVREKTPYRLLLLAPFVLGVDLLLPPLQTA